MTPKTLALSVDPTAEKTPHIDYALGLAKAYDAHVVAIVVGPEHTLPPMAFGTVPVTVIDDLRQQAQEKAEKASKDLQAKAADAGVSLSVDTVTGAIDLLADHFARAARACDMAIVAQADPDAERALTIPLIEAALFTSGRPVLIVPYAGTHTSAPEHVVIGWDGGQQAARAAHDAIALMGSATRIEVVTVDTGHPLPLVEAAGKHLAEGLKRHGLPAEAHVIPSGGIDPGNALLSHMTDVSGHLLVMGGYGHSRMREFIWGGATRELLGSMTVPVLMAH